MSFSDITLSTCCMSATSPLASSSRVKWTRSPRSMRIWWSYSARTFISLSQMLRAEMSCLSHQSENSSPVPAQVHPAGLTASEDSRSCLAARASMRASRAARCGVPALNAGVPICPTRSVDSSLMLDSSAELSEPESHLSSSRSDSPSNPRMVFSAEEEDHGHGHHGHTH